MPTPVRKKKNKKENKSDVWWLRKKVPERYRDVVGRREVWRSLDTTEFKTAVVQCHKLSLELDREWEDRLRAAQAAGRTPAAPVRAMTDWDLSGLQRVVHEQGREAHIRNPPAGARWGQNTQLRDEEEILTATLASFSHLTTPETRAARRWVPWVCAYTGARVNEITSLLPSDVRPDPETEIWCIYLRPEMTKGDYERVIPVHSHLIEQKFLDFVTKRAKAWLPLFYDPKRAQGGENANPPWQKIAERLGEWVAKSLRVIGVKPNHGWRHRYKSVSRHVGMHPEVEKFITGHGGSDDPVEIEKVSMGYGDAWVKTLKKTIEMYPRYTIAALNAPPTPHRRVRRTRAQIEADRGRRIDRSAAQA